MGLRRRFRKDGRVKESVDIDIECTPDMTHTESCSDSETIDHLHEKTVPCALHEDDHSITPKPPKSPTRRQLRKDKKQHLRALFGLDDAVAIVAIKAKSERPVTEERDAESSLHYFWFSSFWIRIYTILLLSVLTREPALLHGITMLILWCMLKQGMVWGVYLSTSQEGAQCLKLFRWMFRFALTTFEKALDGDRMRGFLATKTIQFWSGTGMNFVAAFMRDQSRDIRTRMLKETRDSLERVMHIRHNLLDSRHNL